MSERIKRFLKVFLVLVILFVPFFVSPVVRADSGWDSDYDSGGSWDSGSDWDSGSYWDSGSSWDNDYDYDYDYGSSSYSGDVDFVVVFGIIFFMIVIISVCARSGKGSTTSRTVYYRSSYIGDSYSDITQEHLTMVMPGNTLSSLKTMAYDNFLKVQKAWMNFEYDKLRELCTDELYNSYVSQLETLKLKNGQNIMSDFDRNSVKIIDIDDVNGDIILTVFLSVSFYDYVINVSTNKVTRGNKSVKLTNNYVLTYVVKSDYDNDEETKCPHCGAPINHVTSGKCEYCNSTIVKKASKFVLSKKTNVNK